MGKKSKRRTGKRKQKKEQVYVNRENVAPEDNNVEQKMVKSPFGSSTDDEVRSQNSSVVDNLEDVIDEDQLYEEFFLYANDHGEEAARKAFGEDYSPPEGTPNPYRSDSEPSIEYGKALSRLDLLVWNADGKKAFEEFMLWSLSDKADLTPKKFKRLALAKKLMEGDISSNDITQKRYEILQELDQQIYTIESREGIDLVMKGMKFDDLELEEEFRSQLRDVLMEGYRDLPVHVYLYDSFQEVVSKFSNERGITFFPLSKEDFDQRYHDMIGDVVLSSFSVEDLQDQKEINYMSVFQKYYVHPLRTKKDESFGKTIYAQEILDSLLKLFREMHSCWRCKQLQLQVKQAETLICASCKCAVYCSRECQKKHWREGRHKECCENIRIGWSTYETRKKCVEKAVRDGKIFTKPIIINGKKRKCFVRPSEKLDYHLCGDMDSFQNTRFVSMDAFYENVARLACGGTHPMFGDDTISVQLRGKIKTKYEDILLDFDRDSYTTEEISAMLNIAVVLKYPTDVYGIIAPPKEYSHRYKLSVDHFITLYICYEPLDINKQFLGYDFDRFSLETKLLQKKLRLYNLIQ